MQSSRQAREQGILLPRGQERVVLDLGHVGRDDAVGVGSQWQEDLQCVWKRTVMRTRKGQPTIVLDMCCAGLHRTQLLLRDLAEDAIAGQLLVEVLRQGCAVWDLLASHQRPVGGRGWSTHIVWPGVGLSLIHI